MPVETLETLRLLTNLETEKRKLLQVVLFGQPELDKLLSEPSIRQLKQRITFSYDLVPLNQLGLLSYVRHRLSIVQRDRRMLFSRGALKLLYSASNGIPRLINILCHKALMAAYGRGDDEVERAHMQAAVQDTLQAQQIDKFQDSGWMSYMGWIGLRLYRNRCPGGYRDETNGDAEGGVMSIINAMLNDLDTRLAREESTRKEALQGLFTADGDLGVSFQVALPIGGFDWFSDFTGPAGHDRWFAGRQ